MVFGSRNGTSGARLARVWRGANELEGLEVALEKGKRAWELEEISEEYWRNVWRAEAAEI